MIVVANAGPLIALARIGHFELLRLLYGEIHIPPGVRDEVVAAGQECPGAVEVGPRTESTSSRSMTLWHALSATQKVHRLSP